MSRLRALLPRLTRPGLPWMLMLVLLCAPALFYVFHAGLDGSAAAGGVYALSAYTLVVWALRIPGAVGRVRAAVYGHRWGRRYLTDLPFRGRISLLASLCINAGYALCKLGAGIWYRSFWFGAVAVYYLVLTAMRALLLWSVWSRRPDRAREYRTARLCGWLLLALNAALSAITAQMVADGRGYDYPGTLIFAAALYAFYAVTKSIVDLVRFRRLNSPVLSASKMLGLATALVSMLSLQTAMFSAFGQDFEHQRLMNALTGGGVCLAVLLMAVLTIARSGRALRRGAPDKEDLDGT